MKKKIGVILVVLVGLVVVSMSRGLKSRRQWNAEVPDNVLSIDSSNGFVITNNLDVGGTTSLGVVNVSDVVDISANLTIDGGLILEPPAVVILDTATALGTLDAFVLVIGSNAVTGAFIMVSAATPFISTTTAVTGQLITIMGTDATGTVQLSDDGTVTGSLLELDGNTIVLGLGSNVTLRYYAGKWYQTGGINTID